MSSSDENSDSSDNEQVWTTKKQVLRDLAKASGDPSSKADALLDQYLVTGDGPPPVRREKEIAEMERLYGKALSRSPEPPVEDIDYDVPDLAGITQMLRMVEDHEDKTKFNNVCNDVGDAEGIIISKNSSLNPNVPEFKPRGYFSPRRNKKRRNSYDSPSSSYIRRDYNSPSTSYIRRDNNLPSTSYIRRDYNSPSTSNIRRDNNLPSTSNIRRDYNSSSTSYIRRDNNSPSTSYIRRDYNSPSTSYIRRDYNSPSTSYIRSDIKPNVVKQTVDVVTQESRKETKRKDSGDYNDSNLDNVKIDENIDEEIEPTLKNQVSDASKSDSFDDKKQKNVAISTLLRLYSKDNVSPKKCEKPIKLITPEYFEGKTESAPDIKLKHALNVGSTTSTPEPKDSSTTLPSRSTFGTSSSSIPFQSSPSGKLRPEMKESIDKVNKWLGKKPTPGICLGPIEFKRKVKPVDCKSPISSDSTPKATEPADERTYRPTKLAAELMKKYTERRKAIEEAEKKEVNWTNLDEVLKQRDLELAKKRSDEEPSTSYAKKRSDEEPSTSSAKKRSDEEPSTSSAKKRSDEESSTSS